MIRGGTITQISIVSKVSLKIFFSFIMKNFFIQKINPTFAT